MSQWLLLGEVWGRTRTAVAKRQPTRSRSSQLQSKVLNGSGRGSGNCSGGTPKNASISSIDGKLADAMAPTHPVVQQGRPQQAAARRGTRSLGPLSGRSEDHVSTPVWSQFLSRAPRATRQPQGSAPGRAGRTQKRTCDQTRVEQHGRPTVIREGQAIVIQCDRRLIADPPLSLLIIL